MKVVFSLSICDVVQHDLRLDIYSCSLSHEDTLKPLQHLQNVNWVHAPVLIVITKLEHHCDEVEDVKTK